MEIEASDIIKLCAEVYHFSRKADLRWKGMPVIAWEFADISDFMRTRASILRALDPMMIATGGGHGRKIGQDTEEIDCHGVTFRLICKQKMMTRHGPYGATEMNG